MENMRLECNYTQFLLWLHAPSSFRVPTNAQMKSLSYANYALDCNKLVEK